MVEVEGNPEVGPLDESTRAAPEEGHALQESPLAAAHEELGAKMRAFAGWRMPIEYAGTLAEHRAVREAAGVFDLTHLGKVAVTGPGAHAALQHALSNDLGRLEPGRAQYSLCLTDAGTITDDLLVYQEEGGFLLVPNAANWPAVAEAVAASASALDAGVVEITPRPDLAVIAVQGPRAVEIMSPIFPVCGRLAYLDHALGAYGGQRARVARSGYTGEVGFEIIIEPTSARRLWQELLERGEPFGAQPVGLAARDTLRLEMGYPLHGNDISTSTTPLEAGLGWAVGQAKTSFRGKDALAAAGPAQRRLVGVVAVDRVIPRHGMSIWDGDARVGEVTSGTFSPTRREGIGLAYVTREHATLGTRLALEVRGRRGIVEVSALPFVQASPR